MIWNVSVVSGVGAQFQVSPDSFEWSAQFCMGARNLGCERAALHVNAQCERAASDAPF